MRATQYYLTTLKEAPQEAELASHKLMLRAGLIRKLGSGLYSWMPLGLKVLRKVGGGGARGDEPRRRPRDAGPRRSTPRSCGRRPAAGTYTAR
jgi:hypothetical protein